ncbi:MAG: transcriptional regulator [Actinomycetota bacterium]|nr:transcriptional regulator [Actinomycetota bacterium]
MTTVPELDPVIHAQARLRVVASLAALCPGDRIAFPRVQQLLDMTAGNLSTHLRKLEDAGYIEVTKTHERRTPVTYLALTRRGRIAFEEYTAALHTLLTTDRSVTVHD